jgi:hypothetical protein
MQLTLKVRLSSVMNDRCRNSEFRMISALLSLCTGADKDCSNKLHDLTGPGEVPIEFTPNTVIFRGKYFEPGI